MDDENNIIPTPMAVPHSGTHTSTTNSAKPINHDDNQTEMPIEKLKTSVSSTPTVSSGVVKPAGSAPSSLKPATSGDRTALDTTALAKLDDVGLNVVNDEGRVATYDMQPPHIRPPVHDPRPPRTSQAPTESDRTILQPWIEASSKQNIKLGASMEALTCVQPQRSQAQWTTRRCNVIKENPQVSAIDFDAPFPGLIRNTPSATASVDAPSSTADTDGAPGPSPVPDLLDAKDK